MLVLIVTKTTNYELHGAGIEAKVAQGRVSREALARLERAHAEHYESLRRLKAALGARQMRFDEISREDERPPRIHYDAVITVGGDGTLLAASQKLDGGARVYGVRSSASSVGYLCCAGPDEIDAMVAKVKDDTFPTVAVARVRAAIDRLDTGERLESPPVLNDVLYTNANPAATTRYQLTFDGKAETHRSSGIWVATAAGSTAAILAAGGERRPLDETAFQFRVRELYRLGHVTPSIDGGLFDPDQDLLEIENRCPHAVLAFDGQHGSMDLAYGDRVRFARAAAILLGDPR